MGRKRLYFTEEERKAAHNESSKKWINKNPNYKSQWYQENKEYVIEQSRQWHKANPEKAKEISKKYRKSNPEMARALSLVNAYKRNDKMYNRGECTLTAQWVVDNIFSKPCVHCGVTGWDIIGCNRIDNDKPHTPDNVEPCCFNCNIQLEERKRDIKGKFIKTDEVLID